MPQTKEEIKAKRKEYEAKNKEEINAKKREYYQKNKAKFKARHKKYYDKNKERINACNKEYHHKNKDKYRIKKWKSQGIIDGDFDLLNEVFKQQTHCWICLDEYSNKRIKSLDHDWDIKDDGNVRYICCHICNTKVVG